MPKQFSISNVLRLIGGRGLIFRFSAFETTVQCSERKAGVCVLKVAEDFIGRCSCSLGV